MPAQPLIRTIERCPSGVSDYVPCRPNVPLLLEAVTPILDLGTWPSHSSTSTISSPPPEVLASLSLPVDFPFLATPAPPRRFLVVARDACNCRTWNNLAAYGCATGTLVTTIRKYGAVAQKLVVAKGAALIVRRERLLSTAVRAAPPRCDILHHMGLGSIHVTSIPGAHCKCSFSFHSPSYLNHHAFIFSVFTFAPPNGNCGYCQDSVPNGHGPRYGGQLLQPRHET